MHTISGTSRRDFLRLTAAAAIAPPLAVQHSIVLAQELRRPWAGYESAMVIDALASPIQFNIPQESLPLGPQALEHVRSSGITAVNITLSRPPGDDSSAFENTLNQMNAWEAQIRAQPEVFTAARTTDDIRAAKRSKRLALISGFQHAGSFEDDIDRLERFHSMGLRIVQLTYNVQNSLGAGCLESQDDGLTRTGHDAVAKMDELGILVDLSHCGAQTTLDGITASTQPVSITHSGCNSVFRHPRNKDDATLRLLANRGGVVGIYLMPFLNAQGLPAASHVIDHLEYALNICGEDHVGIGSDQGIVPLDVSGDFPERFEAVSAQRTALGIAAPREDTIPYVPELNSPRRLETIAAMMMERGHSSRVIEKVLGGNFLQLFGEVW